MHLPRNHPTRRGGRTRLLALLAGLAIATLGLPAPALAAPVAGTGQAGKPNVEPLCGTPEKHHATCFALRRTDVGGGKGMQPAVTPSGYGPADLAGAYQLPAGGGAGATVAIVDAFDDPNAEADLAVYRAQFGLPECTTANGCFRKIDQRGGTGYPPGNSGWAGEISLDLDMVSAAAPGAHILLVEADDNNDTNLAAAVDKAVELGAKYVSNSYGTGYSSTPGSGEDAGEIAILDPHYNHPGVVVTAATGDGDYGVSYPASSPYVTSVGGTSLSHDSSPRGWSESVWHNSFGGPGSGCSVVEPKPAFQADTGCAKRAVADISAVADPVTGVAVYDTYGSGQTGWTVFGGTSASAPIIAGVYAAAGTPVAGTYPNSYPYARASALNDVTTGANGTCSPSYLCTAGTGYDGPTGLGTPAGVSAFTTGAHGDIVGTVSDSASGSPVVGARVTAHDTVSGADSSANTDASGHFDLGLPAGGYDLTVAAYGYATATVSGVTVPDGGSVTENVGLTALPRATVSGTVADGSGHGWPLYATVTVNGVPGGPVYTDPFTGRYSLSLPQGQTYQLHVTANYPGYQAVDRTVALGTGDVRANVAVPVDTGTCNAPGYAVSLAGSTQTFDAPSTPDGWTVTNNTAAGGWEFDDPKPRGNNTGGSGGFAIVDSDFLGQARTEDTYLTSPVTDLSAATGPDLSFDTEYRGFSNSTADVDVSVDGGATWSNVWHHTTDSVLGPSHVDIPLPQAAGQSAVQVRFHYTGTWAWWWKVDDVFLGTRSCTPVHGGLVAGVVTDANTKAGLTGAVVSTVDDPAAHATTVATPDDPNLGDGFYWLFTSATGAHPYTASKAHYTTASKSVDVGVDDTTRANFSLTAGRVTVTPASIDKTVPWQGQATQNLTVKNTGTAPATVNIGEQSGGFHLLAQQGAPLNVVRGSFQKGWLASPKMAPKVRAPADGTPAAAPWTSIADFPTPIQDNLVAQLNGKVYSAFGFTGGADTADIYAFDPDAGSWTKVGTAADTREKPAGAVLGGKLIASGGWDTNGNPDAKTEIFDPATNTWSTGAPNPKPYAGSGAAALGGKLYAVGGCTASVCGNTDVEIYDPVANSWSAGPAYPEPTAWEACGTIAGKLYCAGGSTDAASSAHAYVLDPAAGAWAPIAGLPIDLWASGVTAAGGMLLVSGGVTANSTAVTNQGYAYSPATNAWTALPNSNNSLYRGGSSCGFYKVGGNPGGFLVPPVAKSEVLPGFTDCGTAAADVSWLSENPTSLTLAPGTSATVTVTLDAGVPEVTQPGTFTAALAFGTDTPYPVAPVGVSLTVKPPKTWGKITGTVTSTSGTPIAGATVQINTWATSYTLKTDKNGQYALWLDVRNNPLQVIVAKDGFQPQVRTVKIARGTTTTADFALKPA